MSGAMNYSQSKQSSQSNSGVLGPYKDQLSQDAINRQNSLSNSANTAYGSTFGTFQGQTGAQMLGLDPNTGLPATFGPFLQQMAQQYFNKASAGGAMRGQVTPENTNEVVGSAIRGMGGQVLPYLAQFQSQAAMLPEQVRAQRLGYLQAAGANDAALLGSSSTYQGNSMGFGLSASASPKSA